MHFTFLQKQTDFATPAFLLHKFSEDFKTLLHLKKEKGLIIYISTNLLPYLMQQRFKRRTCRWRKKNKMATTNPFTRCGALKKELPERCFLDDELKWLAMQMRMFLSLGGLINKRLTPTLSNPHGGGERDKKQLF